MSHTLLSISGMSPAVITETLFAIQRDKLQWPDQLLIITTTLGASKLQDIQTSIAQLCHDYNCPPIDASKIKIEVITGADGVPVSDARSLADHEALGDFIMARVRDLTGQTDSSVHASIAGGRKTMTFYLGYAMSLFGRAGDQLSHVLVTEPFERVPDFIYPTPADCLMQGLSGESVNAAHAEITLANIPFIRMREKLPSVMLSIGEAVSFREIVNLVNIAESESAARAIFMELPSNRYEILIADHSAQTLKSIPLRLLDYAFYRVVVRQSLNPDHPVQRPDDEFPDTDLAVTLCEEMLSLQGIKPQPDQLLTDLLDELEDSQTQIRSTTLDTLRQNNGANRKFFDTRCNTIKKELESFLPAKLCDWIVLCNVIDDAGCRINFYADEKATGTRRGGYGIRLCSDSVSIPD